MLDSLRMDLRFAARALGRRPGVTAAAIATLALGIGANTAVFSLAHAVLLRPLPYADPDRLVVAATQPAGQPVDHAGDHGALPGIQVIEWYRHSATLDSVALVQSWATNIEPRLDHVAAEGAERLRGAFVTPNFFELLGVRAVLGRTFGSRDGASADVPVVLSHGAWQRRFGADEKVIGRTIEVIRGRAGRARYTVVGVLPPAFRFTYPLETELWVLYPWREVRPTFHTQFQFIARLAPEVTVAQATTELTTILQAMYRQYWRRMAERDVRQQIALVEPLPEHVAGESRPAVLLLTAVAAVVLLIAAVNVALLLLASLSERRREVGMRAAMGAGHWQIARYLLTESALLALAGCAAGVTLAAMTMPILRALVPEQFPRADELSIDPTVLAVSATLAAATAIVCGVAPAWHARLVRIERVLRRSGVATTPDRQVAASRRAIVITQAAMVFVLLVAATLLLRSFWNLRSVDLGYDGQGLVTMEMRLVNPKYFEPGRVADFERQLMERLRALPGVAQASMATAVPMRGTDFVYSLRPAGGGTRAAGNMRVVDHEFFDTMRIPLLSGRVFTNADNEASPLVAIVSERYGRALFGSESPIGKRIDMERRGSAEVIGVVGDVRYQAVRTDAYPALYFSRAQEDSELITLIVRPRHGAGDLVPAIRAAVSSVDPEQPIENPTTIDGLVRQNTAEERFYTATTAAFALTALLLAAVGMAGTVARSITERGREIAIRIAVGASPSRVAHRAAFAAIVPVAAGLLAGGVLAAAGGRVVEAFLFGVEPLDLASYASAALLLGVSAGLAAVVPARRALRMDPVTALRAE